MPGWVDAAAPRRRERGINVLLLTVLGIIATLAFLGVGIPSLLNSVDSARTAKARDIIATDIPTVVHQYETDHNGQLPIQGGFTDVMQTKLGPYLPATPCDPADSSCASTSAASDLSYAAGPQDYAVYDNYPHNAALLTGLPRFSGVGNPPGSACASNACTHLVFDALYGVLGDP